jgi:hypothetical protein
MKLEFAWRPESTRRDASAPKGSPVTFSISRSGHEKPHTRIAEVIAGGK